LQPFLPHNVAHTYQFGIVRRHAYSQIALVDLENQIGLVLAFDRTGLDLFDTSSPMVGVHDGVADLESHVAHTPSAAPILPCVQRPGARDGQRTCRSRGLFSYLKLSSAACRDTGEGRRVCRAGDAEAAADPYWNERGRSCRRDAREHWRRPGTGRLRP